jgi:hypothetical protein
MACSRQRAGSCRAAADADRYTDRARRLRISVSSGQIETSRLVSRRLAPSKASGRSRRLGAFHLLDLRLGNERRRRASGSCDHRGRLQHVGVVIAASACVRAAARARAWLSTVGSRIGPPFGAEAVASGRVEALGKGQRSGVVTVASVWRRSGGCSCRRRGREHFVLAKPHSGAV